VIFLSVDHICDINREWIGRYGGRYVAADRNLLNRASLEYVLTAIEYPVFGQHLFPTLIEKAAAVAWWIIAGHVFNDGNKRTGMQAAIELLAINGVHTTFDVDSLVEIAVAVATHQVDHQQLAVVLSAYVM